MGWISSDFQAIRRNNLQHRPVRDPRIFPWHGAFRPSRLCLGVGILSVMSRMSIVAVMALASATLYGGQAQQPRPAERAQRPVVASPATAKPSTSKPTPVAPIASSPRQAPPMAVATQKQLIDQYCVTCHNSRAKTAGIVLDTIDLSNAGPHAE